MTTTNQVAEMPVIINSPLKNLKLKMLHLSLPVPQFQILTNYIFNYLLVTLGIYEMTGCSKELLKHHIKALQFHSSKTVPLKI